MYAASKERKGKEKRGEKKHGAKLPVRVHWHCAEIYLAALMLPGELIQNSRGLRLQWHCAEVYLAALVLPGELIQYSRGPVHTY